MRTLIAIALCVSACAGGPAPAQGFCAATTPDAGSVLGVISVWTDRSGPREMRSAKMTCVVPLGSTDGVIDCQDSGTGRLHLEARGFQRITPSEPLKLGDVFRADVGFTAIPGIVPLDRNGQIVISATVLSAMGQTRSIFITGALCSSAEDQRGTALFNALELVLPPGL